MIVAEDLAKHLSDPMWRLSHLYKIITKGDDDDDDGLVVQFRPNGAQLEFLANLWSRNIILKARQLGFTTQIAILWLDTTLFSPDPIRCGIVAQDRDTAESIFREKIKFAYENLLPQLREAMPLKRDSASELIFGHNGSSIKVSTSVRGGTIHRLHVSEFGKIAAKYPEKAREVVTGSIPAVPKNGIIVIESTAEGQDGQFYKMTKRALELEEKGIELSPRDYRLHFFAWWQNPLYSIDSPVSLTEANLLYFQKIEATIGRKLKDGQRWWYVATLNADFSGEAPLMWQEYPSFPEEAFQVSTEGCYFATQLSAARVGGRVLQSLPVEKVPVNTFWDLGRGDMTALWLHQRVGPENRFIGYYEATGEELDHYAAYLQRSGHLFGRHFLPHDAGYRRLGESRDTNLTQQEMLQRLMPGQRFEIVPRVSVIGAGIQSTRNVFSSCWFDETACADGLKRLSNYRKEWDKARGCWKDNPLHDDNSHGADAFRQFGQLADAGENFGGFRQVSKIRRTGSPMAV